MGLPQTIRRALSEDANRVFADDGQFGLELAPTPMRRFVNAPLQENVPNVSQFREELVRQRDDVEMIPARALCDGFNEDGRLDAEPDLRLTDNAFSELCCAFRIPVAFARRYARIGRDRCMALMNDFINDRGESDVLSSRSLVIDRGTNTVYGMVGSETYKKVDNLSVFDEVMSAGRDIELSRAALEGIRMRFTAIRSKQIFEPKKGDIIRFGYEADNSLSGESSLRLSNYNERLVCTNGLTRRDAGHSIIIPHRGDLVHDRLVQSIIAAEAGQEMTKRLATFAASYVLDQRDLHETRTFLTALKNAGSTTEIQVTAGALNEAVKENRGERELTLWDFVNSATALSHQAITLRRSIQFESIGSSLLHGLGQRFYDMN